MIDYIACSFLYIQKSTGVSLKEAYRHEHSKTAHSFHVSQLLWFICETPTVSSCNWQLMKTVDYRILSKRLHKSRKMSQSSSLWNTPHSCIPLEKCMFNYKKPEKCHWQLPALIKFVAGWSELTKFNVITGSQKHLLAWRLLKILNRDPDDLLVKFSLFPYL